MYFQNDGIAGGDPLYMVTFLFGGLAFLLVYFVWRKFRERMKWERLPSVIAIDPYLNRAFHFGKYDGLDKIAFKVNTPDGKNVSKARWGVETSSYDILISRGSVNDIVIKSPMVPTVVVMVCRVIGLSGSMKEDPARAWLKDAYPMENYTGFAKGKKESHYCLVTQLDSDVPSDLETSKEKPERAAGKKNALQRFKDRVKPPEPPVIIGVDAEHNSLHFLGHVEKTDQTSIDGVDAGRIETTGITITIPKSKSHLLYKDFDRVHFLLMNTDYIRDEDVDGDEIERWRSETAERMRTFKTMKGKEIAIPADAYPRKKLLEIPP